MSFCSYCVKKVNTHFPLVFHSVNKILGVEFCWKDARIDPTTNTLHMLSTSAFAILKLKLNNWRKFKFGNINLHIIVKLVSCV